MYSGSSDFRTLAGPDNDGDGVVDALDACPATSGTLSNGCLPAVVPDPDKDGIYGAQDLCPRSGGHGIRERLSRWRRSGAAVAGSARPRSPGRVGRDARHPAGGDAEARGARQGHPRPRDVYPRCPGAAPADDHEEGGEGPEAQGQGCDAHDRVGARRVHPDRRPTARPAAKALRRARAAFKAALVLELTAADKGVATSSTAVKVG